MMQIIAALEGDIYMYSKSVNMNALNDDDDDFLTASKGFSYFCNYWHI